MILTRTHQHLQTGLFILFVQSLFDIFITTISLKYGTAASYITVGGPGLFLTPNKEEGYPFKRIATLRHLIATFLAL